MGQRQGDGHPGRRLGEREQRPDPNLLATDFDTLSAEILTDPDTVARFDASDLMPGAVGTDTFWTGIIDWFASDETASRSPPPSRTPGRRTDSRPSIMTAEAWGPGSRASAVLG